MNLLHVGGPNDGKILDVPVCCGRVKYIFDAPEFDRIGAVYSQPEEIVYNVETYVLKNKAVKRAVLAGRNPELAPDFLVDGEYQFDATSKD